MSSRVFTRKLFGVVLAGVVCVVALMAMSLTAWAQPTRAGLPEFSASQLNASQAAAKHEPVEMAFLDCEECDTATAVVDSYDITGDCVADTLDCSYDRECLNIHVNGKLAASLRTEIYSGYESSEYCSLELVTLKNKKPFIVISFASYNDNCVNVFQYRNGKLRLVDTAVGIYEYEGSVKYSGNTLYVYRYGFVEGAGNITVRFTYQYKNGLLRLVPMTTTIRYSSNWKNEGKPTVKAYRNFKAYKNFKLKKKAFVVKKNKKFKIVAARIHGDKLCLQVKCGKKRGWVDANSPQLYKGAYWYVN